MKSPQIIKESEVFCFSSFPSFRHGLDPQSHKMAAGIPATKSTFQVEKKGKAKAKGGFLAVPPF